MCISTPTNEEIMVTQTQFRLRFFFQMYYGNCLIASYKAFTKLCVEGNIVLCIRQIWIFDHRNSTGLPAGSRYWSARIRVCIFCAEVHSIIKHSNTCTLHLQLSAVSKLCTYFIRLTNAYDCKPSKMMLISRSPC
jgi:hypothetical protein